jgi:hypothetical protein
VAPTSVPIQGSSMIGQLDYDDETEDLDVHFVTTGGVYRYHQVPADVFTQLSGAASVGSTFTQLVKNRYAWERIS